MHKKSKKKKQLLPVNGRGMSLLLVPEDSQNPRCFLLPLAHVAAWKGITNNPWVITTMTQGYRLQFVTRPTLSRVLTISSMSSHFLRTSIVRRNQNPFGERSLIGIKVGWSRGSAPVKIINATLLFLPPFFKSWTQRYKTFSMYTKCLFLSNIVHKFV